MCKLTVFTPSFNRAHLLINLYNFLRNQSYKDFQWLIVDDGSTDNTKILVEKWVSENYINIKYVYQENKGKHVAYNKGIELAEGELFVCIDSDDIYHNSAFSYLVNYWNSLENKERYSGLCYLSQTKEGNLIGTDFPEDEMDSNLISIYYVHNVKGDKGIMFKTSVLKENMFPIFEDEHFLTESVLYAKIGLKYKTRFINKILEIKEYQPNGLSSKYRALMKNNPKGALLNYKTLLLYKLKGILKIKTYIQFIRFSLLNKKSLLKSFNEPADKLLFFLMIPIAFGIYINDKISKN
ncbi:glycosyltransferase family 2 protein [Neobacillus cucumis]|uniref:glycosyltransferase family 2 protein n=1 Tax=Neobacillus cucumis TaxID=1740721 RepID=UPI0018DFE33A|nr:glycosyltransferase family 2 protein [Neobacillus cucumis]MBI0577957.1 glycosyltransferase family 2 protein [Neobacillus cucumis]